MLSVATRLTTPLMLAQDPKMQEDTYERTFEQNEELGLNDIKVRVGVLAPEPD